MRAEKSKNTEIEDQTPSIPDTIRKKVGLTVVPSDDQSNTDFRELPKEIGDLPESVQVAVSELPMDIINRLLYISENVRGTKESLESILAKLDDEGRERLLKSWLQDMFFNCKVSDVFHKDTKNEILRFLTHIWDNRGKRGEEVEVLNKDYYENFEAERARITHEIRGTEARIEQLRDIMKKVKKKRRETEKKEKIMRELRSELKEKQDEFESFDRRNQNLDIDRWSGKAVHQRHELEKKLTESAATAAEFFDPAEFAILITEAIESSVFYQEKRAIKGGKWFGKKIDQSVVDRCKESINAIEEALTQWSEENENSPVFRKKEKIGNLKRIDLIINYFKTLLDSYETDPENRIYELRQMENAVGMLKRMAD